MIFTRKNLFSHISAVAFVASLHSGAAVAQTKGKGDDSPRSVKSPRSSLLSRKSSSQGVLKRSSQASSPRKAFFTLEPTCPALKAIFVQELEDVIKRGTGQEFFRTDGTPSVEIIKALVDNSDAVFEFKKRIVSKTISEIKIHRQEDQEQIAPEDLVLIVSVALKEFFDPAQPLPPPLTLLVRELHAAAQGRLAPDQVYPILGVPVFLRCICPALGTPEQFGIKADEYTRKALVLVAKALQLMTNRTEPGDYHACFPIRDQLGSLQSATRHAIDSMLKAHINGPLEVADVPIGETTLKKLLSPPEVVPEDEDYDIRKSPYGFANLDSL